MADFEFELADDSGQSVTASEAEWWLRETVSDYDKAVQVPGALFDIDHERGHAHPTLAFLVFVNNRDRLADSPVWMELSDFQKCWAILLDDDEIDRLTRDTIGEIVHSSYAHDLRD